MASSNSPYLKTFALTSTFAIATSMTATSALFIPSLLRPLTEQSNINTAGGSGGLPLTPTASRPNSSLNVPQTPIESGRLTPHINPRASFDFTSFASSISNYKAVAQQFASFEKRAFIAQVPLEFLTIAAYSLLAYRSRDAGRSYWAAAAGLVAVVFPYTGILMAPLQHKVSRLAGDEEKIEPYEDAPIDREAEKTNTITFLQEWNGWNLGRVVGMVGALVLGVRAGQVE